MKYHRDIFDRIDPDKRKRILTVATAEFAVKGFHNANVNVIADKLSISIGSLYKYFGTKENLFLTVVNQCVIRLEENLGAVSASEMGFFEKIEYILRLIQKDSRENIDSILLYNEFTTESNSELSKQLSRNIETLSSDCYSELIRNARDEGLIAAGMNERAFAFCLDNLFLTLQFSYAVNYYKERMKIYIGEGFDDDEMIVTEMMKFIRNAFGKEN